MRGLPSLSVAIDGLTLPSYGLSKSGGTSWASGPAGKNLVKTKEPQALPKTIKAKRAQCSGVMSTKPMAKKPQLATQCSKPASIKHDRHDDVEWVLFLGKVVISHVHHGTATHRQNKGGVHRVIELVMSDVLDRAEVDTG